MANDIILQMDPSPHSSRNSEGAFVSLYDDRVAFAWSKFTTSDSNDNARSIIACIFSDDGGLTWGNEKTLIAPGVGESGVMSVSLLKLQNDRILFTYLRKVEHGDETYDCRPMVRFSDNDLQTTTDANLVMPVPGYYVLNNDRVIQLRNGRILMPLALHRYRLPPLRGHDGHISPVLSRAAQIIFLRSDDGGYSWLESINALNANFTDGYGFQEPGVVELRSGGVWSWMRTEWTGGDPRGPHQWESFSGDDGVVWSPAQPSPDFISASCSPASIKKIPQTGHLFAVWNDQSGYFDTPAPQKSSRGRTPLICAISADDGQTWQNHKMLESDPSQGYCYTAIHFTKDAILLAYSAGDDSTGGILNRLRIRRMTFDEVYA